VRSWRTGGRVVEQKEEKEQNEGNDCEERGVMI